MAPKRPSFLKRYPQTATILFAVFFVWYARYLNGRVGPGTDITLPWDALVPFHYSFAAFYLVWIAIALCILLVFFFRSPEDYLKLFAELASAAVLFLLVSTLFPNRADIRAEVNPQASVLAKAVTLIYEWDDPASLLPGLHPFMVLAVTGACRRTKLLRGLRALYPLIVLTAIPGFLSAFLIRQLPLVSGAVSLILYPVISLFVRRVRWNDLTFDRL